MQSDPTPSGERSNDRRKTPHAVRLVARIGIDEPASKV
jgi:hypothetical protein